MWRFILISFAFMGWSFYVLSGGSDYAPTEGSLQAQIKVETLPDAQTADQNDSEVELANSDATETSDSNMSVADNAQAAGGEIADATGETQEETQEQLLALLQTAVDETQAADVVELEKIAADEPEQIITEVRFDSAIDAFRQPVSGGVQNGSALRQVSGNNVNLRSGPGTGFDPIDQLIKGTDVEVIANEGDWVQLRVVATGRTGWMANWLVAPITN